MLGARALMLALNSHQIEIQNYLHTTHYYAYVCILHTCARLERVQARRNMRVQVLMQRACTRIWTLFCAMVMLCLSALFVSLGQCIKLFFALHTDTLKSPKGDRPSGLEIRCDKNGYTIHTTNDTLGLHNVVCARACFCMESTADNIALWNNARLKIESRSIYSI